MKIPYTVDANGFQLLPHPETGELVPEVWADIEGLGGHYQISNYGRAKSFKRYGHSDEHLLKLGKDEKGYVLIYPSMGSKKYTMKVHQLVAKAFVHNPNNKPHVNHIKPDKKFNVYFNLEWCTIKENVRHAELLGLRNHPKGKAHWTYLKSIA